MAKRPKATDGGEATGTEAIRGNGFDKEKTTSFVERIEELQDEIDGLMADAKDECAPKREDIASIKKEAHDAGLPRKELNAVIAKRRVLRRIEARRAKLSEGQQDNFDQIEVALGMFSDTPLGRAAVKNGNGAHAHA